MSVCAYVCLYVCMSVSKYACMYARHDMPNAIRNSRSSFKLGKNPNMHAKLGIYALHITYKFDAMIIMQAQKHQLV